MAYQTTPSAGGAQAYYHADDFGSEMRGNSLVNMTNIAGAVVSVALIAGVGVWGYQLMVRDVTGIPIVKAMQGEMRVKPTEPGGELAQNQGLSVNAVAAEGNAEAPAERLILAPQPVVLTEEDQPLDAEAVAIVQQAVAAQNQRNETAEPAADAAVVEAAVEAGDVTQLVEELTRGVTPLDHAPTTAKSQAEEVKLASAQGVKASLRPRLRPAGGPEKLVKAAVIAPPELDIDPASLPAGTRLVQLGAYDNAEQARSDWGRFSKRFGELLRDKSRVIQQAQSGGRTFYRLRAHGFADLSAARRFCSALVAEGADCIPVVTR